MAETLSPSGIVIPEKEEAISAAGVAEMRTVGATANSAYATLSESVATQIEAGRYTKGRLTGTNDAFALEPGIYTVGSVTTAQNTANLPEAWPGTLIIESNPDQLVKAIRFLPYDRNHSWETVTAIGEEPMVPWRKIAGTTLHGRVSGQNDALTLSPGVHTIGSVGAAEATENLPEDYPGTLLVLGNPGEFLKSLLFFPYNRGYFWWNVTKPGSSWMGWKKIGEGSDGDEDLGPLGSGGTNALLIQDFSRRHGGVWSTGGKAAVSFRLDHGLATVRDTILPMFRAAGIVPSLALNSRNWERPENGGVTPEQVDGWVSAGDVEIWNHSATHSNPTSEEGVWDEVVTGLSELREQLPSAQIDGWAIPGVGSNPYLGMGTLTSVQQIYGSYAGRLILEHHAVTTGHIGETWQRVLDGTVRQAQRHYGLDSRTPADAIAQIDYAIEHRTGLQLMVHPSVVDGEGKISTAGLQQVVDYMVQKRDAGELVICSPYQMMVADATIPAGVDVDAALAAYRSAIA